MGEVTITVNGRPYRMACEDGQEPHLRGLGADLANRVQELAGQVGKVGDAQLLVMAALIAADEAQVASTAGGGAGDDEAVRSLMAERDALIAERDAALAALDAAEAAARKRPNTTAAEAALATAQKARDALAADLARAEAARQALLAERDALKAAEAEATATIADLTGRVAKLARSLTPA